MQYEFFELLQYSYDKIMNKITEEPMKPCVERET